MKKRNEWIAVIAVILVLALIGVLFLWFFPSLEKNREEQELREQFREYYDTKVAAYAAVNATLKGVDVAFIGDSLTDGYDLAAYYPEFSTANRGIGGDTTFGVEERMAVSLYDLTPRAVVMMIGSNNIDTMFDNYESLLKGLAEHLPDTEVVLLSIPPTAGELRDRNTRIALNNVRIKALAEQYGYAYVDLFTALLDHEKEELRAEYTTDGAHFTPLGYEVITSLVKPVLTELLPPPAAEEVAPTPEQSSEGEST